MTNELLSIIDDLNEHFTNDAWSLLKTFFLDLQAKLMESGIPAGQQATIVEGLGDFIGEFVEDYKNKEKINYESALILLREIGSPTDIILTLDTEKIRTKTSGIEVKVEMKSQRTCPECQYPNVPDAIFCENCGRKFDVRGQKIVTRGQLKDKIIQESIDHVYTASFLVIYTVLGGLGFIMSPIYLPYVSNLIERLIISFGVLLVPAIVLALIAGAILSSVTKDRKSFKFKYNQVLNHFEEMATWGFLYAFLASVFFGFLTLMGLIYCLPIALIILITSFIWVVVMYGNKPQGIPYLTLLKAKRVLSGFIQEKLMKINLYGGTVIVVFVLIWNLYVYSLLIGTQVSVEGAIIVSILQIIAIFLGLNGYLMMYYYSWPYVNRYIAQEVE